VPETTLILSTGSIIGLFTFFYTFNKDSNSVAAKMSNLETRLQHLETDNDIVRQDLNQMKDDIHEVKVCLGKIDTKLSSMVTVTNGRGQ